MAKVESFDLDHTRVRAPYVRLAGIKETRHGDTISKYDLRLLQPNAGAISSAALHTLEHLLAFSLRDHIENVLDVSPMGCRTGMYLTVVDDPNPEAIKVAFEQALTEVARFEDTVPGVSELECGNYRDHDLAGAKKHAQEALERGLIVQETLLIDRSSKLV